MSAKTSVMGVENAAFALSALQSRVRLDARHMSEMRDVTIQCLNDYGQVMVALGETKVLAVVTGEVVTPFPDRPNDGFIGFSADLGPMASPAFSDVSKCQSAGPAVEISQQIDRLVRGSRSFDTESLCVLSGAKVWSLKVDVKAINDDGNLFDAAAIGALTALVHYRKRHITYSGQDVTIHSSRNRDRVPLSLHHHPIQISLAFFSEDVFTVDPSLEEEQLMLGRLTVAVTYHGEVCGIHKPGGIPLGFDTIKEAIAIASEQCIKITDAIEEAIKEDTQRRQLARKDIRKRYDNAPLECLAGPPGTDGFEESDLDDLSASQLGGTGTGTGVPGAGTGIALAHSAHDGYGASRKAMGVVVDGPSLAATAEAASSNLMKKTKSRNIKPKGGTMTDGPQPEAAQAVGTGTRAEPLSKKNRRNASSGRSPRPDASPPQPTAGAAPWRRRHSQAAGSPAAGTGTGTAAGTG
eukprot:Selendium_serpulae@DN4027_c1_g1_i1.p1